MPRKLKILFVDDDEALDNLFGKLLLDQGFDVDVESDGEAAMERLSQSYYDVAVIDNHMPKMTGLQVLENIRGRGLAGKVIMITAADEGELAATCLQLGATEVLAKPFDFEMLLALIQKMFPPE